jgi:hypothetical protein
MRRAGFGILLVPKARLLCAKEYARGPERACRVADRSHDRRRAIPTPGLLRASDTLSSGVGAVAQDRINAELAVIEQSLSERLRPACAYMSEKEFWLMVKSMARVQWKAEHRSSDPLLLDGGLRAAARGA